MSTSSAQAQKSAEPSQLRYNPDGTWEFISSETGKQRRYYFGQMLRFRRTGETVTVMFDSEGLKTAIDISARTVMMHPVTQNIVIVLGKNWNGSLLSAVFEDGKTYGANLIPQ